MTNTEELVRASIIAMASAGDSPKTIAQELKVLYPKVLRVIREYEDANSIILRTDGVKTEPVDYIASSVISTGCDPASVAEIVTSERPTVEKGLELASLAVLQKIANVAAFTENITAGELDQLATAVSKLRLAFNTGSSESLASAAAGAMKRFQDVLRD